MTFVIALKTLHHVLKETHRRQAAVLLAAVLAVFTVHLLALVGFVTLNLAIVERHGSTLDLVVLDSVVWTAQMLGYAVNRPAVLQTNFNFVSFFAQKVLTFSMFCGIIGIVHSDDPFELFSEQLQFYHRIVTIDILFFKTDYCNFIL